MSYPFLIEPRLSGLRQAGIWRIAFAAFVLLALGAAGSLWRAAGQATRPASGKRVAAAGARSIWLWIGWSACGVVMFMATTNQMTLNVASVPFVWVLPLGIYLLTFILTFSGRRTYPRGLFVLLLVAAIATFVFLLSGDVHYDSRSDLSFSIVQQIGLYVAALFVVCMVCNGELFRLRPPPELLTGYYLSIAFGGALGGFVVAVLAPMLFSLYQELHFGLVLSSILYLVSAMRDPTSPLHPARRRWAPIAASVGILLLVVGLVAQTRFMLQDTIDSRRGFFGVLRVVELSREHPRQHSFQLIDGAIAHGHQLAHPDAQRLPTLYYASITGIGQALNRERPRGNLRVGVVGLGIGTLAAYGRPGDSFRFYGINPDVIAMAREHFTFLEQCEAEVEIVRGDTRLSLEREAGGRFDFLILDAFSSDAIPVHLLTTEAFDVYERQLGPGGVLALHLSNLHFDLPAMAYAIARERGLEGLTVVNRYRPDQLALDASREIRPWTDNDNNLFRILR